MSWNDNTPDREIDPPEHDHARCEMCDDTIPPHSKSWCFCDSCFDERVSESSRQEMRNVLLGIARGLDRLEDTTMGKRQA